jgi:hypothetical protein
MGRDYCLGDLLPALGGNGRTHPHALQYHHMPRIFDQVKLGQVIRSLAPAMARVGAEVMHSISRRDRAMQTIEPLIYTKFAPRPSVSIFTFYVASIKMKTSRSVGMLLKELVGVFIKKTRWIYA